MPERSEREDRPPLLRGRSRGAWRLTDAADYDRYGHDLLPVWAQLLLGAGVGGLAALLAWRATSPVPSGDLWRVLAYLLPLVLIAVALLVRAGGPEPEDGGDPTPEEPLF